MTLISGCCCSGFWLACTTTVSTAKSFNCLADLFLCYFHPRKLRVWCLWGQPGHLLLATGSESYFKLLSSRMCPADHVENICSRLTGPWEPRVEYTVWEHSTRSDFDIPSFLLFTEPKELEDQPWCFISKRWWTECSS